MKMNRMICRQVAEGVTEFMEGSLSWEKALRFRLHFWTCFGCRNFLDQMKYTLQALQKLPRMQISPRKRAAILQQFRAWKHGHL